MYTLSIMFDWTQIGIYTVVNIDFMLMLQKYNYHAITKECYSNGYKQH